MSRSPSPSWNTRRVGGAAGEVVSSGCGSVGWVLGGVVAVGGKGCRQRRRVARDATEVGELLGELVAWWLAVGWGKGGRTIRGQWIGQVSMAGWLLGSSSCEVCVWVVQVCDLMFRLGVVAWGPWLPRRVGGGVASLVGGAMCASFWLGRVGCP